MTDLVTLEKDGRTARFDPIKQADAIEDAVANGYTEVGEPAAGDGAPDPAPESTETADPAPESDGPKPKAATGRKAR